jgi:hypothetical protein
MNTVDKLRIAERLVGNGDFCRWEGSLGPNNQKTKSIYPPALGDITGKYPVYRGTFPFKSHFGRIVLRENGLKRRFFNDLRRFIFLFWREKIIPKCKFTEKTRRTNIAL